MLDGVSLDQLRTFIAAADEGSFSAAGRRLRRAQSVVSQTLANLEGQLGVKLFDRSARIPVLTDQGRALLGDARAVAGDVDLFKARAKSLAGGLEAELSLVVDAMIPLAVLASAVAAFQVEFPSIPLKLYVEMWEAVADPVLDRRCAIGLMGSMPPVPPELRHERVLTIRAIRVVSPQHPLAAYRAPIPMSVLAEHIQLVHGDLSSVGRTGRLGSLSPRVWRLCDLAAKHHFLRAGFGFGIMPLRMVEADPMPSRKPQVRDRILSAATELFSRRGIRSVSVDAIATEAGSNKMSFYRHFRSKEQLAAEYLHTLIREAWEHWDATIAPFQGNPRRQLEALFAAHLAKNNAARGCAFANVAIEIPNDTHVLAGLVRGFKLEVGERLRKMAHKLEVRDPGALGDALMLLMDGCDFTRLVFRGNAGPTASLMIAVNALIDAQKSDDECDL